MPYIVTTKRPIGVSKSLAPACKASRRAVATLEEARANVQKIVAPAEKVKLMSPYRIREFTPFVQHALHLPESGGTVGPLPDGTVIEVEPITREAMLDDISFHAIGSPFLSDDQWPWSTENIIAAFNAKQAG